MAQGSTTATWVSTNALSPNTTYFLRVFAVSSCNGVSSAYGTSAWFTTPSNPICITPGAPLNVIGTAISQNSANLNWSPGILAGTPTVRYFWVVGTTPNVQFGHGVIQGITTDTWFPVHELTPGTTYYLRVYAVANCNNVKSDYGTSAAFTTHSSCLSPTIQSSNISFSSVSTQQFTVNWNNGNGNRRVVKINTSNNFTPPADGTDPVSNSVYVGYGEQVVFNGVGNSVTVTGLPLNSTMWIRIYEANCSGTNSIYNVISAMKNPLSQNTVTVVSNGSKVQTTNNNIGIGRKIGIPLSESNGLNQTEVNSFSKNSKSAITSVFPNPASELINFYVEANEGKKVKIDIYNSLGQKIGRSLEEVLNENIMIRQLDCSAFERGVYNIVIHIDDKTYNHKLIIID